MAAAAPADVGVVDESIYAEMGTEIDEIVFAPLDDAGIQLLFRLAAAYEGRSLAIASHWPFEQWGS